MPTGIQRLNAKNSQPNERIVFIKPLKGPDEEISRDFLERIAAQCLPIMKTHYLSVMSLEEYEPNQEFVGRNFNAGEVIQLVLKARSGHWLPFQYVQMVMMHELAHCKQMNHSKAFWAVRNQYAEEMRSLWARKYMGEGLWGRGALLSTGEWEKNTVDYGDTLPEHLCGGTYRSRARKRKAKKPVLSYKEQKERRILKKFGANGVALGEDAETKKKLEKGKKVAAKPRVAGSARGRELRAAAALARFDQQKKDEDVVKEGEQEEGSETDSGEDYEEEDDDIKSEPDALDLDGKKILDGRGRGMVKVCEDENIGDDQDAQQELRELLGFGSRKSSNLKDVKKGVKKAPTAVSFDMTEQSQDSKYRGQKITISQPNNRPQNISADDPPVYLSSKATQKKVSNPKDTKSATNSNSELVYKSSVPHDIMPNTCPICSFANEELSATCAICANVLDPRRVPGSWACTSQTCKGSKYRNAGDSSVCGVCGERKKPTG
ncbi:DNA-dependent metalloprotease WSS1 [Cladorrhinum sp. PSN259]|nr:DNA-dependent metalloprotease WSS1 [Cladorrhinum sp. PSN259]